MAGTSLFPPCLWLKLSLFFPAWHPSQKRGCPFSVMAPCFLLGRQSNYSWSDQDSDVANLTEGCQSWTWAVPAVTECVGRRSVATTSLLVTLCRELAQELSEHREWQSPKANGFGYYMNTWIQPCLKPVYPWLFIYMNLHIPFFLGQFELSFCPLYLSPCFQWHMSLIQGLEGGDCFLSFWNLLEGLTQCLAPRKQLENVCWNT